MRKLIFSALILIGFYMSTSAQSKKIKHVVLVGFDGFGAYAIPKAEMPELRKMMEQGSYNLHVRTVLPSSSAVNWASMLMGASPTMHGYTEWGSQTPEIPSLTTTKNGMFPSIFNAIADKYPKAKTAVVHSWPGIGYLIDKKVVQHVYNMQDNEENTLKKAIEIIKQDKPMLTFIHFDQPDGVGHGAGHDTPAYYAELKNVDKRIGDLRKAVKEAGMEQETIFIVTADHGGIEKGHGGKTIAEVEVPFIAIGPGVPAGNQVTQPMVIYDIAATITWLLGADQQEAWRGKAIKSFQK
ncbi:alkaline phosphatase [Sphingobacterium psychroaquaticum]|uniref:Type I phosphodiesterase / nucleotide pyrophosphatase n=1 Tax=Sphingobacterium psychroaquaticum TaxID=561061 RepID=A0A1X7J197_9SPHI|nr:alkaline phosphatase [Sphingobacterium psychroaquaticum]SMG20927.1 Type I phosphodiesterase / nucleotide pyrophosphatase [Sphingobacterium psychroaquaticum]